MSCTIIINPNTSVNNPRIDLYNTSSYQYFISNYYNNSFFDLGTQTTGDIILRTNTIDQMHILNSNGYVGINNSSPAYTLDVVGSARFTGSINSGKSIIGNVISAGVNWQIINTGYTNPTWVSICYGNGMFVAVGQQQNAANNIMTSTDGINWTLQTKPDSLGLFSVCYGNGMFVTVGNNVNTAIISSIATSSSGVIIAAATNPGYILLSTNTGSTSTWSNVASSQAWTGISMDSTGTYMAACVNGGNIWVSTNTGSTWTSYASSLAWSGISMNSSGTTIAACVNGGYIWVSTNTGVSWTSYASSLAWSGISMNSTGTYMAACVNGGFIWYSSDTGSTWSQVAISQAWSGITSDSTGLYIAAFVMNGYCYYSANYAADWSQIINNIKCIKIYNNNVIVSSSSNILYKITQTVVANQSLANVFNTGSYSQSGFCISDDGLVIGVWDKSSSDFPYISFNGGSKFTSNGYYTGTWADAVITRDGQKMYVANSTNISLSIMITYPFAYTSIQTLTAFSAITVGATSINISYNGNTIIIANYYNLYISINGNAAFTLNTNTYNGPIALSDDGSFLVNAVRYYNLSSNFATSVSPFTTVNTIAVAANYAWFGICCTNTSTNSNGNYMVAGLINNVVSTSPRVSVYFATSPSGPFTLIYNTVLSVGVNLSNSVPRFVHCSANGSTIVCTNGNNGLNVSTNYGSTWLSNYKTASTPYSVYVTSDGSKFGFCEYSSGNIYTNYSVSNIQTTLNTSITNNINTLTCSSTGSNIYIATTSTKINIGISTNSGSLFSFAEIYFNSNFYYSLDSVNWILTKSSNIYGSSIGICYGNNTFVVMVSATSIRSLSYYSYDGVNWYASNTLNTNNTQWTSVCYGNQIFIAIGQNGTNGNNIAYSYDGKLWSISTTQNTSGFYQNSICYANGNFAICDQAQNIYACNFPSSNTFVSSNVQSPYSVAFDTYGYMYVGNQGYSGSIGPVSQFNATTGAVVNANFVTAANISNSNNVWSIAIDSANNLYICVDGTSGSTTAIYKGAIASNGTISGISVFINTNLSGANYCGFDNLGNFFVSNYNSYAPYVNKYIMTTPGTIGTTITNYIPNGTGKITGIAFDSTNNMYLSNYNTNTILKYTNTGTTIGSTGTLLATITIGNTYNNGIAIDSGNNIYVSFYGTGGNTASSGTLTKYDPNGNLIYTVAGGLNYPGGMTINRGNIYLAISNGTGQTTGSIAKITQLTLSNTFNNISSGLASPFGIVFDSNGYIYVANEYSGTVGNNNPIVKQYYPNGTIKNSNFVPGRLVAEGKTWGIAMDAYNNLYITDGVFNYVFKFSINANGNITNSNYLFIKTGLNVPQGCAFDNSGNFYVSNFVSNGAFGYINKYIMLNGVIQSTIVNYATGLWNPWQMAFDSANNMYVTGLGQNVYKYSPTGTLISNAYIGLYAMGIAIDSLGNFYLSTFSSSGFVYCYPSTGGITPSATLYSGLNYPAQLTINNGILYVAVSTNTGQTTGSIIRTSIGTNQILAYGNGTYVSFVQGSNYMLYSNDISNNIWKSTAVPRDVYRGIAYGNGEFVTIGQNSGNVLLSGLTANSAPPNLNMTYNNVYVNNSITLYDNTDPIRSRTGLQSYSNTGSNITLWSLVYSSNNLVFTSYADFIFNVNSINSLASNGTNALYIKSDGNVGIGKGSTTANYTLDISGNVFINAYSIFGPNDFSALNLSGNTYALTASDSLTDASVNTLASSVLPYGVLNIVRPDDFNRSHLALNQYNTTANTMYTWQIGYVYNGAYTSNLGIFGPSSPFSQTAIPCISFYSNNSVGINTKSTSYTLDVSGTGRFTQSLQSGNLTCNTLSVTTPRRWFITNTTGSNYTTTAGNILGSSGGGGGGWNIVWYNDATGTGNTDFNTTTGKFTAPENGLYLFQLSVFDNASNNVGRRLAISGTGVPYQYDSNNNIGKFETFNQTCAFNESSYTMTDVFYLTTGQTVYYYVPITNNSISCVFYYTYSHTTLKIFKIR